MRNASRRALLAVLFVLASVLGFQASVQAAEPRVPVLMVHGFNGKPQIWGAVNEAGSMRAVLSTNRALSVEAFDYQDNNLNWVDNPRIGRELAKKISAQAAASRKEGGLGKVILVAHSMGGLAIRQAATEVVDGRKVSDDIGLVVTIGTPNKGAEIANWAVDLARGACNAVWGPTWLQNGAKQGMACSDWVETLGALSQLRVGSPGLSSLPMLPASIPVRAIAGNIQNFHVEFFGAQASFSTDSDGIVSLSSATAGANLPSQGGGAVTIKCDEAFIPPPIPALSGADCSHGKLVGNPKVQASVVEGIKQYLASLKPKPSPSPSSAKPTGASCPSAAVFAKLTSQVKDPSMPNDPSATYSVQGAVICDGNWAVASEIVKFPSGGESNALVVFRHDGKAWVFNTVGTDFAADDPICQQATSKVKVRLGC